MLSFPTPSTGKKEGVLSKVVWGWSRRKTKKDDDDDAKNDAEKGLKKPKAKPSRSV